MRKMITRLAVCAAQTIKDCCAEYIMLDTNIDLERIADEKVTELIYGIRQYGAEVCWDTPTKKRFEYCLNNGGFERVYHIKDGKARRIHNHSKVVGLVKDWGKTDYWG